MLIKVDKDNVKIIDKANLHKGEYGLNKCEFEFSEEYNGLVKMAVFKCGYNVFKVDIINDICDIPSEVLEQAGDVILGVYAYASEKETLLLRYSPVADTFKVGNGSYTSGGNTPSQITPSQYELYSEALNEGLDEVRSLIDGMDSIELVAGENITITREGNKIIISATGTTPSTTGIRLITIDNKIFLTSDNANFIIKESD